MHTSKSSIHKDTPEIVLKSVFKRYDTDGDGDLSMEEFSNALEDLGIIDETEQKALFSLADAGNHKKIKYTDFVKLIKSNDFESILSSPKDYEFVIETFRKFQYYDHNGDGEVTWSEFYFYLSKHGYSHASISQYWYYMSQNEKMTISFEGFWKGYKIQHAQQCNKARKSQINQQIINTKSTKKPKKFCQTFNRQSFLELVGNNSWDQNNENNIFNYALRNLSASKHLRNPSPYSAKVGRVLMTPIPKTQSIKVDISNSNTLVMRDFDSQSSIASTPTPISQSYSQCNGFNFVDYGMEDIEDDIQSVCSSVSTMDSMMSPLTYSNHRNPTSMKLMVSDSLEVKVNDSVAIVSIAKSTKSVKSPKKRKKLKSNQTQISIDL